MLVYECFLSFLFFFTSLPSSQLNPFLEQESTGCDILPR